MNELPEQRRAIHGVTQREAFDHQQGIMGPYRHHRRRRRWLIAALAVVLPLALVAVIVFASVK